MMPMLVVITNKAGVNSDASGNDDDYPVLFSNTAFVYLGERLMDLDFTEEQIMLRDMAKGVCEEHSSSAAVREMETDTKGYSDSFWNALSELGVVGLTLPETYDGMNLGLLETAIVYEEFGRTLAPTPHFVSSILSAKLIELAGTDKQKTALLPELAIGEKILTVAWNEPARGFGAEGIQLAAELSGDSIRLNGTKIMVPYANSASQLIVLARQSDNIVACLVDVDAKGVELIAEKNHASETLFQVKLNNVEIEASAVLGDGSCIWSQWDETMTCASIALAAQAIGGAEAIHAMAVEYAKQRMQFGKAIGSFQSISHYLADLIVDIEGTKVLVYQAAWAKDNGKPYHRLSAMAKLQACNVFRRAAAVGVQVHGGFGFTTEGDPQLFFRRAKQQQVTYWDSSFLEKRIASYVLDEAV